jgi:hypothetical protein
MEAQILFLILPLYLVSTESVLSLYLIFHLYILFMEEHLF